MAARLRRLLVMLRRWRRGDDAERDLHEEIESYADMLADERRDAGVTPAEARRQARAELGGVEAVKESVRQGRAGAVLEQTLQDVRYALRGLRRTQGFTAAAMITLALGIGVSTAVFSVVDATLLKPLPYRDTRRLVDLGHHMRAGTGNELTAFGLSPEEIEFWRSETAVFEGIELYESRPAPVEEGNSGATIQVERFSAGLPALLGVAPAIGRVFTREEASASAPVAVISDGYWRRRFSRSPSALGATLRLAGETVTIIGVMPPTLRFGLDSDGTTDVWRSLTPGKNGSSVFRLRPPLTLATALQAVQPAASRLQLDRHDGEPWTAEFMAFDSRRANIARVMGNPLWVLFAMSAVVLLIVCANLGNLLRTRFLGRRDELAMRAALGASRSRVARLLLAEGALVIALGGVAGALVAAGLVKILPSLVPPRLAFSLFAVSVPRLDARVAAFGLLSLGCVAFLTISFPALYGARPRSVATGAGTAGRIGSSREGRRATAWLQAFQMGLALLLVTVTMLVALSLFRLKTADLGFKSEGLSSLSLSLPASQYAVYEAQQTWYARVLQRVRSLPDVEDAAFGNPPPSKGTSALRKPGDALNTMLIASAWRAGEGYFHTAGIPVIEGREFQPTDRAGAEPVVILSASAARALWPGESAVGRLVSHSFSSKIPPARVIGVVGDVASYDFAAGKPAYGLYTALAQEGTTFMTLMVRARSPEAPVVREAQEILRAEEPDVKVTMAGPVMMYYETMETYAGPKFYTALVVTFAILALVTAAVGLYGLLAYSVGQRRREIGVRMALGSTIGQIRGLVLADALWPVTSGLAVGWMAAWLLTRYLGSLLYGISPRDPIAFLASGGVLLVAAFVAALAPIRRATGVDPIRALRVE